MLTKSQRYYWDAEAVKESSTERPSGNTHRKQRKDYGGPANYPGHQAFSIPYEPNGTGRNLRSVWAFTTQPYPEAHFAVFPEELPRRCILAATSEKGNCPRCGKPWVMIVSKKPATMNIRVRDAKRGVATAEEGYRATQQEIENYGQEIMGYTQTLGWQPQCSCGVEPVPATVLDPFCGAGTTLKVAKALGRRSIGIDISERYCALATDRVRQMAMEIVGSETL